MDACRYSGDGAVTASGSATTLAGRYRLLELVGEGGMGVVWRAHDDTLGRDVAIKLLRPWIAADEQQRRRFAREARTLAGLANEHIVRVHDFIDDGEQSFLVMEYIHGDSLANNTFARLPISVGEAASYVAPVASALAYAHAKGVVHRDLTPANILIERDTGRVVTTDFGLARIARSSASLTTVGVLVGTPEYWSPEQALGRETDTASDLYALGCILCLLISGRLPFEGDDRLAVGLRRAHEQAPPLTALAPAVPRAAAELVDSLLAADANRRPEAAAAARALNALATEPQPVAWPVSRPPDAPAAVTFGGRSTAAFPDAWPTLERPSPRPRPGAPESLGRPKRPRRPRRRLVVLAGVAGAGLLAALLVAGLFGEPVRRIPKVVSLGPADARAQILQAVPGAKVSVSWMYSTRVARGRVISQRPAPRTTVHEHTRVMLRVSKGTPFAVVPAVSAGHTPDEARAVLGRNGFSARLRYTPSWDVRKGAVIELRPHAGTRIRRPATVRIVVASGYPREVVPGVVNTDLVSARSRLEAKHLRYQIVYRLTQSAPPSQVVGQIPAAGAVVYRGSRIRLTVARTYHWVNLFNWSGTSRFRSDPFRVHGRWRVRYRLSAAATFLPAFARVVWSRADDPFGGRGFDAGAGSRTYAVDDGAGTYRLAVEPLDGTNWTVSVDAYE